MDILDRFINLSCLITHLSKYVTNVEQKRIGIGKANFFLHYTCFFLQQKHSYHHHERM